MLYNIKCPKETISCSLSIVKYTPLYRAERLRRTKPLKYQLYGKNLFLSQVQGRNANMQRILRRFRNVHENFLRSKRFKNRVGSYLRIYWLYVSYFHLARRLHDTLYPRISRQVVAIRNANPINGTVMKHFTLSEFTRSATAEKYRIENTPNESQIRNLECLCSLILDPLRDAIGYPIYITSGFRTPRLNRLVGGSKTSAHIQGLAADFIVGDEDYLLDWAWCLLKSPSKGFRQRIDQCIYYRDIRFIHVSLPKEGKARGQFWME